MKTAEEISNKIALKFRKAWDKNNYSMSDGKSIEIWIKKSSYLKSNVQDKILTLNFKRCNKSAERCLNVQNSLIINLYSKIIKHMILQNKPF
jgi:hypothetical protein